MAERNTEHSTGHSPEHQRLNAFVGRWNTIGKVRASASGPAIEFAGTDTYEWLPGGFFLLHRVDVRMGNDRAETTEIIGYDASSGIYPMHYFDDQGNAGTMQARFAGGVWTFSGDAMRFTGGFSEEGDVLSGIWERQDGGEWQPWMDVTLRKAVLPSD